MWEKRRDHELNKHENIINHCNFVQITTTYVQLIKGYVQIVLTSTYAVHKFRQFSNSHPICSYVH